MTDAKIIIITKYIHLCNLSVHVNYVHICFAYYANFKTIRKLQNPPIVFNLFRFYNCHAVLLVCYVL